MSVLQRFAGRDMVLAPFMNGAGAGLRVVAVFAVIFVTGAVAAQAPKRPAVAFATVEQGRAILANRDEFVMRMSAFDRAGRLKTDQDVSESVYLKFAGESVLAWTPEEKAGVNSAWAALIPKLDEMKLPFPGTITFIKTSGAQEGGQEYTRGEAIVLPQSALTAAGSLTATIAHELFHILSRNAPELRERLYAVIGFYPCGEVPFLTGMASRKLTDPDAPRLDDCIRLRVDDAPGRAVLPVMMLPTRS